jgi:hypothetical protein
VQAFKNSSSSELLNLRHFDFLLEAHVLIEHWRIGYTADWHHSAYADLTPTEFALRWANGNQQTLSSQLDQQTSPLTDHCARTQSHYDQRSTVRAPVS